MPARLLLVITIAFAVGSLAALTSHQGGVPGTTQTGRALIGGPFTLTNQKGERVTDETFRGKYMLVSFGYSFCPDVSCAGGACATAKAVRERYEIHCNRHSGASAMAGELKDQARAA